MPSISVCSASNSHPNVFQDTRLQARDLDDGVHLAAGLLIFGSIAAGRSCINVDAA